MELLNQIVDADVPLHQAILAVCASLKEPNSPSDPKGFCHDWIEKNCRHYIDDEGESCMKVVVLARYDLKMSAGKLAAQVGHSIHSLCRETDEDVIEEWEDEDSFSKIVVLGVESMQQLDEVCAKAESLDIGVFKIEDAGRTEVAPGSLTVAAIGPCYEPILDVVTGHLRPYKEPKPTVHQPALCAPSS
jgi:PTH2 family peptidyl-tRNA hydrolase